MWNDRKLTGTPFLDAYENLLLTFGTDYKKVRHNNITKSDVESFFKAGTLQCAGFPNHQHLDLQGLLARVFSSSYIPQNDPRIEQQLRSIFDQHHQNGAVTIEYNTELFYGKLI